MCGTARSRSIGALAIVFGFLSVAIAGAADPSFNKDIAPLLWTHCGGCHRPGAIAPFSLIDYRDVVPRARQIVAATAAGTMPPWLPEPGHGAFQNERRLTADEKVRIARWVEVGTPQGASADLPARPRWSDQWPLGVPDLVVEVPSAYALRPGPADVFRNFVVPMAIPTRRFVRGIDVDPGDRSVVHHASISLDRTRASRRLDAADPEPGFSGGVLSGGLWSPENRAIGWTPGMTPSFEPPGLAWPLEPGTDLVLNVHMIPQPTGEVALVRPRVALYFSETPPTRTALDFKIGSKTIDIPAGAASYVVEDSVTLSVDVDLLSIYPHAHYLAKDMVATATRPDGSVTSLLWISRWDFHWQDQYRYRTPVPLPRGATLTMRYTYDNSTANKHNPRSAPARVVFGPESSDEMGDLWLRLLPHNPEDAAALAAFYVQNERRKDREVAERMVVEHPSDPKWRNALGTLFIEVGRLDEGEAHLLKALELAPDDVEAHNNLGHVRQLQGRPTEALPHFQEAARLAPSNDLVQANLANALQDLDRLDEAIAAFGRAVALNPDAPDLHNNLGVALGSVGRLDDAEREFRRALELQPGYADARQNLDMLQQARRSGAPG